MLDSFGGALKGVFREKGQLCVGLDPSSKQLSSWGLSDSAEGASYFCGKVLDACYGQVGIVKIQVAFFEQFGSLGFSALEDVIASARSRGLLVIADAKRGDIGSTMEGYARAWLSTDNGFDVDAVTLSPYLGAESLLPAVSLAKTNNKGVFVLAATSNPEAKGLQAAIAADGHSIAFSVAEFAIRHNSETFGSVGLVFGADTDLAVLGINSSFLTSTPILVPGFGAQGSLLKDVRARFGEASGSVICNVSRSVAGASVTGLRDRILMAKSELEEGLAS